VAAAGWAGTESEIAAASGGRFAAAGADPEPDTPGIQRKLTPGAVWTPGLSVF
jgi:hypothetical protein